MPHKVSAAEVETFLKGIDYPVSKDQLIDHAKKNKANKDVMMLLDRMPEQTYNSPIDVSKGISEVKTTHQ